jgi:hypothetical protein
MDGRSVIRLSALAGILAGAAACTPFKMPIPPPDASGSGGSGGSNGSILATPAFETLVPAPPAGGAVLLTRQRLSAGSSVTCNGGICFSGGIEP